MINCDRSRKRQSTFIQLQSSNIQLSPSDQLELRSKRDRGERTAMDRRRPQLFEELKMVRSAVALVLGEAVTGVLVIISGHDSVAGHLGENRGGGDAETLAIATDDMSLWDRKAGNLAAINQDMFRRPLKGGQRALDGAHGCPIDDEAVDLLDLRDPEAEGKRAFADLAVQFLALFGEQLLGIVHAPDEGFRPKYHRGGDHRTRHRPDPRLIDSRDRLDAGTPEFAFVAQVGMTGHGQASLLRRAWRTVSAIWPG